MTRRPAFNVLICLFFWQYLVAQRADLISGQFIIHVQDDQTIQAFRQQLLQSRNAAYGNIQMYQIMKEPFSLWLFQCSAEEKTASYWKQVLTSYSDFTGVYPNRSLKERVLPNDPEINKQWQYINPGGNGGTENADIDMDLAWNITTGGVTPSGDTIVVCIIDDGINGSHEDMRQNLWLNHQEVPDNGIDDDGNGYADDLLGWNVVTNTDDVYTGGGHGTPVAGVVGARGNNGTGVSGVNWNVKLMIVNYGSPTEANALASYGYAYTMRKMYNHTGGKKGAYVVATNASWGVDKTTADEAPLWCALYDSLGRVGIVSCGATTNSDTDVDSEGDLPTSCESDFLISVTNMNRSNIRVTNSGYGTKSIDLGSYGHQIYTVTRTGYGTFGGTSGATPHVAGVIGLLYALPCQVFDSLSHRNPELGARIIRDAILNGVKTNVTLQQITTSGGVLNAFNAIKHVQALCDSCASPMGVTLTSRDQALLIDWPGLATQQVAVRYRQAGESRWTIKEGIYPGSEIIDLQICSEYEVQIGAHCGEGEFSYQYSRFVKTTGCCAIPVITSLTADSTEVRLDFGAQKDAQVTISYSLDGETWRDTLASENSVVWQGIPLCRAVYFRLQAECKTYGNASPSTQTRSTSTPCGNCTELPYCGFSKKDDSQEWIEAISLAGTITASGSSGQGYSNFAGIGQMEIVPGNEYPFTITVGYAATPFPDFVRLFADLNQDGNFQSEETLFSTPAPITEAINGRIYIPENSQLGYTRLRVILSYESFEGACDSDKFEYGEVEDHCIFLSGRSCPFDANVKWLDADKESMRFAIAQKESMPDTVFIRYRKRGESEWQQVTGTDSIRLTGLSECTLYEVEYRSFCGKIMSMPSVRDTFRTACTNNVTDLDLQIRLWPNPATSVLRVSNLLENQIVHVQIFDSYGREWLLGNGNGMVSGSTVDISQLLPGWYQLVLTSKRGDRTRVHFVKVK